MDIPALQELLSCLKKIRENTAVRVVLLKGAGSAFCSGGDVGFFKDLLELSHDKRKAGLRELVGTAHEVIEEIVTLPVPVIACLHGVASGYGLSLALASDLILAQKGTRILSAYSAIGATPDGGLTFFLPELVGRKVATDLMLTNRIIDADEAQALGIVNQVLPKDEWEDRVGQYQTSIISGPVQAQASIKKMLWMDQVKPLRERLSCELKTFEKGVCSKDFEEGVSAFFEKRKAIFS